MHKHHRRERSPYSSSKKDKPSERDRNRERHWDDRKRYDNKKYMNDEKPAKKYSSYHGDKESSSRVHHSSHRD